ncbi:3-oxoacyl-[acyl-carrier-protein] reductase FabG-like isoform X1 [Halictus rubicundus]|uniref:3-oxoacyl-[acyl-carrier-protein] reductase FabG-like isoform X1 n=2 Tax=Halictus rubicundus TaxID=77578 RepID=UPI00403550BE
MEVVRQKRAAIKGQIIGLYKAGFPSTNIATIMKCSERTVRKYIKSYRERGEEGLVDRRLYNAGRARKTTTQEDHAIIREMNQNPSQSASSVAANLDLQVCPSTVRSRLREAGYPFGRPPRKIRIQMAFSGKVVLITGASSGIGAATAVHFSQLGASLLLTGRNLENLNAIAEKCKPNKPLIVTGELTNEVDAKNIIESTIKHYGRLDVLVNNAGVLESGSIENTSMEQYDRVFNINVRAIYNLTMLAVPHIVKTKGNIVNISSVCGLRAFPGVLSYCMTKAAIDQFTKCVALELAEKQVRVNAVNPGVVRTNLHETSGMKEEQLEAFFEHSKKTHALGRPGDVTEVAKTIAFLASDDASFITGATLPVDGGRHAMCPR